VAKFAIFGGSFDPPTYAHKMAGELVYAETDIDQFWYMPCCSHKFNKDSEDSCHRLTMVERMVYQINENYQGFPFRECTYEIDNKTKGHLIETMEALEKENPKDEFVIVVGSDCANDIKKKWHRGKELIERYPFIVLKRSGYELLASWPYEKPNQVLEFGVSYSSTTLRKALSEGDFEHAQRRLYPAIFNYIKKNKLYSQENQT